MPFDIPFERHQLVEAGNLAHHYDVYDVIDVFDAPAREGRLVSAEVVARSEARVVQNHLHNMKYNFKTP